MADTNSAADFSDQDLFIFANDPAGHGALYHMQPGEWQNPNYTVPRGFAVSIRDMLADGGMMIAFPMDNPFQQGRMFYAAHLYAIDILRNLSSSGTAPKPSGTSDEVAAREPEPLGDNGAPVVWETQPNDLYLFAPPDGVMPRLFRLPEKVYKKNLISSGYGFENVHDMIAHGTVLAAMPPTAGTLCYLISLASLSTTNQAFCRR